MVELVPPPTAAVVPSVPVVPDVAPALVPPIELLPVGVVEAVEITQLVFTVREAPWQIATAPDWPPAMLRSAIVPFTTVRLALSGRGLTTTVYETVELLQPAVVRH